MNIHLRGNRQIPALRHRLVIGVGAVFMMFASQSAASQQSTSAAADTSLLSAILRAAISEPGRGDLRVDPRPLVARAGQYSVRSDDIVPVSALVVRERSDVIQAAGLRTVDATRVNQNTKCPGTFVIGRPDSLGNSNSHVGCPQESFYVLAVGLPRPGRDVLAGDEVYDRDNESAGRGYWAARVIRTLIGPGGSSVHASDYVLAKCAGTWVVIKIVGLMYTE